MGDSASIWSFTTKKKKPICVLLWSACHILYGLFDVHTGEWWKWKLSVMSKSHVWNANLSTTNMSESVVGHAGRMTHARSYESYESKHLDSVNLFRKQGSLYFHPKTMHFLWGKLLKFTIYLHQLWWVPGLAWLANLGHLQLFGSSTKFGEDESIFNICIMAYAYIYIYTAVYIRIYIYTYT